MALLNLIRLGAVLLSPSLFAATTLQDINTPFNDYIITQETAELAALYGSYNTEQLEPLYVGSARYSLNKSHFKYIGYNGIYKFEAKFPVDGDYGQELIYDIIGKLGPVYIAYLDVRCGNFYAQDQTQRIIISKTMTTSGSCKEMSVSLYTPHPGIGEVDISVMVSEKI